MSLQTPLYQKHPCVILLFQQLLHLDCTFARQKKESGVHWNELVASIVKNTFMTVRDINELSFPELEELMDGMSLNAEKERAELEGAQTTRGGAEEFMQFMLANS